MKNVILFFTLLLTFGLTNQVLAVQSLSLDQEVFDQQHKSNVDNLLSLTKSKKAFFKKKKKKKKKSAKKSGNRLTRNLLISWITTGIVGVASLVLGYVAALTLLTDLGFLLFFLGYILFVVLMLATLVLFIIWLVRLLTES